MAKKNCTPCRIPPISTPSSTIKSINPRCYFKSNQIMKKNVLALLLLAAMANIQAQDTLRVCSPRSNYYWTDWMDTTTGVFNMVHFLLAPESPEGGICFHTPDTLTVYGIAACLTTEYYDTYFLTDTAAYHFYRWAWCHSVWDSAFLALILQPGNDTAYLTFPEERYHFPNMTLDSCCEALRLYKVATPEPEQLGEDLWVNLVSTPVSYYFQMPLQRRFYPQDWPGIMLPVYERYFSNPVSVIDSFFLAITNHHPGYTWPVYVIGFSDLYGGPLGSKKAIHFVIPDDKVDEWHYPENPIGFHGFYFFPILTPPEGSSAVSAQAPEVLDRYVALQPNPATDRVTVTSSFGLTRIEVRDAAGRKLHDAPASGFSASLDLSRFPSGTLILTIHTPAGPATKKLLKP